MLSPLLSLFRNARALVLLAAVACLTPERARAGCEHPGNTFKTNLLAVAATPADAGETTGDSAPTPCPCQGPNCSGEPDGDVPPTAAVLGATTARDAALPGSATDPAADGSAALARDRAPPIPIDHSTAIFHPPRAGRRPR
jgi:hypothetical protein